MKVEMLPILYEECEILGYKPRDVQVKAIEFLEDKWDSINTCKVLSLPTGSGKSMIAKTISKFNEECDVYTAIITPQNMLIDQYTSEFPHINNLKGRSHYPCKLAHSNCQDGQAVQRVLKKTCNYCPYKRARQRALVEATTFFNPLSYLSLPKFDEREIIYPVDTIIVDEFQTLASMIRDLSTIKLWETDIKWSKGISDDLKNVPHLLKSYCNKLDQYIFHPDLDFKEKEQLRNTKKRVEYIIYQITNDEKYFVCEENREKYKGVEMNCLLIRPKYIPSVVLKNFFKIARRVILMSGTAFPFMWEELGFPTVDYIDLPSPIPKERRSFFVMNTAFLSSKDEEKHTSLRLIASAIKHIVDVYHPKQNGVVLLPYNLADEIRYILTEPHYVHMCKNSKKSKIEEFKSAKDYQVGIFSGSYEGLNLTHNISRFTIIPKVPYPNLLDKVVKTRANESSLNYGLETMSVIIQASGRSTRSEKDYSYTYVLDSNFLRLYSSTRKYLPNYFRESIVFHEPYQHHIDLFNKFTKETHETSKTS